MKAIFRCRECNKLFDADLTKFTQASKRVCPSCGVSGGHVHEQKYDNILSANGLDSVRDNIKQIDLKTNYEVMNTAIKQYFKIISKKAPKIVKQEGFDPENRDEVNFTNVGPGIGEWHGFKVVSRFHFKFIFAFLAKDQNDSEINKAMKILGWLPEQGETSYQYVFSVPGIFPYASSKGEIKDNTEVMFPYKIKPEWLKSAWKLDMPLKSTKLQTTRILDFP